MLHASDLKAMPPQHVFASGEGEYHDLRHDPVKWVAIWGGLDWAIYVSSTKYNYKQVREFGKIVDANMKKLITSILPCAEDALNLYRK